MSEVFISLHAWKVTTFKRLKKGSRHWWYFAIFAIFVKTSLKTYQLWPNRTNRADWKFGYLFFATPLGVSEVFISLHKWRITSFEELKKGSWYWRFLPILAIFAQNLSTLTPQNIQSQLEFLFSVFATPLGVSGVFISLHKWRITTLKELKTGSWFWRFLPIFAIFAKIRLKTYQLWPHRTFRASWNFRFLFFGVSSGESKVVIYPRTWTNCWF